MSPEQARGQVADARSDLFSLGAVLHEMLTGAAPFTRATTIETLAALLERDPPSLSGAPGVPPEIVPVAARLLVKNPAERYQTAAELLADLRHIQRRADSGQPGRKLHRQPYPLRYITHGASGLDGCWLRRPCSRSHYRLCFCVGGIPRLQTGFRATA